MSRLRTALPAVAVAAAVLALPLFVHDRYLLKVLSYVGIDVVVVLGLALLFGFAGQISLGQAAFFGIGAYTSGVLVAVHGWPWVAGVAAAIAASAAAGALLALPVGRLRGHYLAMATLGFSEIALVAFTELKGLTGGTDGLSGIPYPALGPFAARTPGANYVLVWGVAAVAYVVAANVVALRPGRALRALHGSENGAQACGIDVGRTKVVAFSAAAGLAGLGGALYAHLVGFISPGSFTLELSILLVAMIALGGMGSLPGAVLGAVLLGMLPYLDAVVPGLPKSAVEVLQSWEADIYGLVLILVMLFMPRGIAGALRRLRRERGGER